jgi:hypothetical protein
MQLNEGARIFSICSVLWFEKYVYVFFWVLSLFIGKSFPDISKKQSAFSFKGLDCWKGYYRASRILRLNPVKPQVFSFVACLLKQ